MAEYTELESCIAKPVQGDRFNPRAVLPYGLVIEHVHYAMTELVDFLGFINTQLHTKGIGRLEKMLMPANFSSVVGEFVAAAIPKFCQTLVKNRYHNGHPDLIPSGLFPGDAVQHSDRGIEVKSSRCLSGWQGHNPEDVWLMVFVFDCNRPTDNAPRPFRFLRVVGARLERDDWMFSGRSTTSRRTITASVTKSGYAKMMANWIYDDLQSGNVQ